MPSAAETSTRSPPTILGSYESSADTSSASSCSCTNSFTLSLRPAIVVSSLRQAQRGVDQEGRRGNAAPPRFEIQQPLTVRRPNALDDGPCGSLATEGAF